MTVIGLTGGIASGKSTAANWLREAGAVVIDADRVGHRVYEPGTPGFEAVVNEFGHDIVAADGTINRQLLGGKVFGRPDQMERLTNIVWPEIRRLAAEEVNEIKRRERNVHIVLEAAVLVEANWFDLVDEVWVVTVEPDAARDRIVARNGLNADQAQARIDSQLSNKERTIHAYVKIDNSGSLDDFQKKVDAEWLKLLKRTGTESMAKPKPAAKPAAPTRAASKADAKPAAKAAAARPASKVAAKPAAKVASKPAAKPVAKQAAATRPAAKPAAKPVAKKATVTRPAAKPAAKKVAATRPAAKAASKAVAKKAAPTRPAAKPVAKKAAATRPAAKPVAKKAAATRPAAKPAAKKAVASRGTVTKTSKAARPASKVASKTAKTAAKSTKTAARRAGGR